VNYSTVVGLGGIGLVGLNFWDGTQRQQIAPILSGKGSVADAHGAFKELGEELVFVVIATVLAGLSNSWGVGMTAVIVGLLIIWSINRTSSKAGG
jgi:hypothetical protein